MRIHSILRCDLGRESSSDSEEHDHASEAVGRMQGPPKGPRSDGGDANEMSRSRQSEDDESGG